MWAQGNQWGNQIPLDAAAYQNMNHELVDWASLAQQWIRMKEVHETVVLNVPEMAQSHYQSNINLLRSSPAVELQPSDSNVTSGEAPMDVEKEDEITSSASDWSWQSQSLNQQTHNWPLQHGPYVPRHSFPQVTHPGAANLPTALGPSQTFLSTISPSMNFTPRVPLLPLPPSARPNSSDEDSLGASSFNSIPSIDASKRKNLPAWIREGLEKMEKEKQKKEEREKFLLERELRRKKELESGGQGDLAVTRSRFDDSEEEEDDTADEIKSPLKESTTTAVPNAQTLEDIMVRIRQLMTEILLEVTTEEIRSAAVEASQRAKVKNRQVQSPLSSKSLTRKLGLDQYGSDSEGDDSDQETVKVNRTSGFDDGTAELLRGKNYEKQQRMEETRASDRFSHVEKDLNHPEKPSHSVELEKNKSSGESFSKVLQDGTKVDKDINNKFLHGHGHAETSSPSEKEDSAVKSEKISDCKREISVVRENSMTSKSQDRSNAGSSRSRQRSRSPERRKRSRSRDCQYSSRRSRDYPKSRRRSRSRERKRSNSRRRSRDRRRSVSRRRSRSNDRKSMGSKGKERASSKDRRK
ncbi:arginine/serine-rich protein PNISR-like [Daphnia pulicaria]|uniref:arginine/serine-rich protein PNISR-like n=1 Tax=Daphnia pulicaria TaxID=35523 RepID=UPI001EEC7C06|nr:arginine/serine-rich protein PNISR-like [Daphnia pulicaria]XP_046651346.1 arginine/serine-rich protein PNISR-like [Daphnia pulicaria]